MFIPVFFCDSTSRVLPCCQDIKDKAAGAGSKVQRSEVRPGVDRRAEVHCGPPALLVSSVQRCSCMLPHVPAACTEPLHIRVFQNAECQILYILFF